jgi:flagellar L-ring protein precursor FlgH
MGAFPLSSMFALPVRLLGATVLVTLVAGCQHLPGRDQPQDDYEPLELDYSLPATTSGGLYRAGYNGSLMQDRRALRVGDILTIVLNESTQSSKSAGTSYDKSTGVGIGAPTVLGETIDDLASSASASREFAGSAKSSQQNTLRGAIAVTVHRVLPNGTLLVKGEKGLRLNQGDEYIRVTGLVRVDDINRNNQVSSQNIANAKISYSGRGALNDSNTAGWLSRFFTSPLFPL